MIKSFKSQGTNNITSSTYITPKIFISLSIRQDTAFTVSKRCLLDHMVLKYTDKILIHLILAEPKQVTLSSKG